MSTNLIIIVTNLPAGSALAPSTLIADVFPVSLPLVGAPCLVVGQGPTAAGRVRALARCGAAVTALAAQPCAELAEAEGPSVAVVRRAFAPGDSAGHRLVFAATGDRLLDEAIAADARAHHALVHVEDTPALCDFHLPALHRSGPVVVAVSTGGTSPALASWLRTRIAALVGPEIGRLAEVLARCRETLRAQARPLQHCDWSSLLDDELLDAVRRDDADRVDALARTWLEAQP